MALRKLRVFPLGKLSFEIGVLLFILIGVTPGQTADDVALARQGVAPFESLVEFGASDRLAVNDRRRLAVAALPRSGGRENAVAFVIRKQDELFLNIVERNPDGTNLIELSKISLGPGFLWSRADNIRSGLQIADFNGDGRPDVMVIVSRGASLGGILSIFSMNPQGSPINIMCEPVLGWRFSIEESGKGRQIEVYDRYSESSYTYRWNGKCVARTSP